ncbi:unnamed protein product, partial [marine sediment metagenome]
MQKVDQSGDLRAGELFSIRRHVATPLNHLAHECRPVESRTHICEIRSTVSADSVQRVTVSTRDAFFIGFTLLFVLALAVFLGPDGPGLAPDPANVAAEPVPDWYFLSLFAVLALSPRSLETYIILIGPVLIVAVMLMLPLWAGRGERHPY